MSELRVELPPDIGVEEARLLLGLKLYEAGRLTLGQAAKLSGYSKAEFMTLLGRHGVPLFNYTPEDLEREMSQ